MNAAIPLAIIIIYMASLYVISWYCTKLSRKGTEHYLLAGRGMPTIVVATLLAGLAVGGASTVGVAENAYKAGISAGWYNGAWAAGALAVGLIAAARYRNWMVGTIPEIFERYYGKWARILAVVCQIVIHIVITSLQYLAGGAILAALLPQYFTFQTGTLVSALVFIGIALMGGLWAAGLTNVLNVLVIYVGIIAGVVAALTKVGGFGELAAALPPQGPWFAPFAGVGGPVVLAWFLVMITQAFSVQATAQIAFAAKNDKAASRGFLLGALFIFPVGFMSALFGIIAAAKFPGIQPTLALPKVVLGMTSPVVAGLVLAGLWAADVSTACGLLLGSATLVVNDIWRRYINPNLGDRESLLGSRIVVLLVSVLTYLLAITVSGILKTILIGLTLTTAFTIVLLATMFTPRLCRKSSAVVTLLAGIVQLLVWQLVPATRIAPHPIYLAWPVCLAAFLLTALFDKRPAVPEGTRA